MPGIYNDAAKVKIDPEKTDLKYDFLNLSVVERTNNLHKHFLILKEVLRK